MMNNKEYDEMRFGYIHTINEITSILENNNVSIEINDKISIDAEIPEKYIRFVAEMAVVSFNYGCEELIDDNEYDEDKDYKISYSDIDVLKVLKEDD